MAIKTEVGQLLISLRKKRKSEKDPDKKQVLKIKIDELKKLYDEL